ncbi:MAG TPA: carboxypeptidase-like regulatory domain-containing protein, partial [Vicinamibacteria bacterium]|nr:carboxypeptidase-like regulatory domain-containing protein [Vicinamibacteria bacterium]
MLDRGDIVGTVTDETGAALPGVTVTVTHVETGLTRVVTTDSGGRYVAKLLPVGSYVIIAELPAFATVTREGAVVEVGSAPVINVVMP